MQNEDKRIIENLLVAVEKMPESKRERFLGFAEGVAAMSEKGLKVREDPTPTTE